MRECRYNLGVVLILATSLNLREIILFILYLSLNLSFFPKTLLQFWLKLRQGLNFSKNRKRIKISELVEYIVYLVFVGQVCPTDQPKLHKRTKMGNLKIVGWKMFYVGSFKIILRTFPPLNFWWE